MNERLAIQLLLMTVAQAQSIGELISRVRAEGRDVTSQELDALVQRDDEAKRELQAAIEARRSPEAGG